MDSEGEIYFTGYAGANFAVTAGAFQKTFASTDTNPVSAFVMKMTPNGFVRYATFLGGSGRERAGAIAVDSQGCAYITGVTSSSDFPVTPGAFQTANLATLSKASNVEVGNAFVTKLNANGSALVYSTYLGGHSDLTGADTGNGIAVDSFGNAYITGTANSLDFPTTQGAFQRTAAVKGNGFVTKLNPAGNALTYSTYLGGNAPTECRAIAVDSGNGVYVTGHTSATDFPITPGAFAPAPGNVGDICAFVTKLNAAGSAPAYSTYLIDHTGPDKARGDNSTGRGIAVDSVGSAYVTGDSYITSTLTTPGAIDHSKPYDVFNPRVYLFVTKLNVTGTARVYSANLGTGIGFAIAIDRFGNACVTGSARENDYPTTVGAFQPKGGQYTAVLSLVNTTGTALLYSTYLGKTISTEGDGVAIDNSGRAVMVGGTYPQGFPTTQNALLSPGQIGNSFYGFVTNLSTHSSFPDFNGDSLTDLLLLNHATGQVELWTMHGSQVLGATPFDLTPPTTYTPIGVGDFSGDGSLTLVFQSIADNRVVFWYTNTISNGFTTHVSGGDYVNQTPNAEWRLTSIADFDKDGRSDLLFQNIYTGQLAIWYLNGPYYQGGVLLPQTPGADWKAVGAGDFNGDGFADIVFQSKTTGKLKIWALHGSTFAGEVPVPSNPAAGWQVVSVGDFNGDGNADLVFQNQTARECVVWYMNGAAYQDGNSLSQYLPATWTVFGPR